MNFNSAELDCNDFVEVACGRRHNLALKQDGTLVGWSGFPTGETPDGNDYVAIAAGYLYSLALKKDGSIVEWGLNDDGLATPQTATIMWLLINMKR